jgi:hypothetical protein
MNKSAAMNEAMKRCVADCQACHAECLETALHTCLETGGRHTDPQHFRLMMSCAQVCQTAADLMSGRSQFHARLCALCAEICDSCAQSCEDIGGMEHCAELCRRCSQSCREMLGEGAARQSSFAERRHSGGRAV